MIKNTMLLLLAVFPAALFAQPVPVGKKVEVYTTAENTDNKISKVEGGSFESKPQPLENEITVFVDPGKKFQTYMGIGAALTDASAETFYKMPKAKQEELLKAYFDKKDGIGYTVARTNINSCDFSSDMYTYVADGDASLKSFSIEHDKKYKIPFIKEATKAAGGKLTLFASPWSPPSWMKTNNDMLHGGKLKPGSYKSWALYYAKFIKAYEKECANERLREEIASIRSSISSDIERLVVSDTDILYWISGPTIERFSGSDVPIDYGFRSVAAPGYIFYEGWDCWVAGSGHAYIKLKSETSLSGSTTIRQINSSWRGGTLSISAPFDFRASGGVTGHLDPCIGGGAGVSVSFSTRAVGTLSTLVRFHCPLHNY